MEKSGLEDCPVGVGNARKVAQDGHTQRPTRGESRERAFRALFGDEPRAATAVERGRSPLKIVDVTEFYSERGGGVRSHLTTRGQVLSERGHGHLVIAPGPRDEDAPSTSMVAPPATRARVVRIRGAPVPYDGTYHLLARFDKVRARVRFGAARRARSPFSVSRGGKRPRLRPECFADTNGLLARQPLGRVSSSVACQARRQGSIRRRRRPLGARDPLAPGAVRRCVRGWARAGSPVDAGRREERRSSSRFGVDTATFRPWPRRQGLCAPSCWRARRRGPPFWWEWGAWRSRSVGTSSLTLSGSSARAGPSFWLYSETGPSVCASSSGRPLECDFSDSIRTEGASPRRLQTRTRWYTAARARPLVSP